MARRPGVLAGAGGTGQQWIDGLLSLSEVNCCANVIVNAILVIGLARSGRRTGILSSGVEKR
jgi:hypothetical protein